MFTARYELGLYRVNTFKGVVFDGCLFISVFITTLELVNQTHLCLLRQIHASVKKKRPSSG